MKNLKFKLMLGVIFLTLGAILGYAWAGDEGSKPGLILGSIVGGVFDETTLRTLRVRAEALMLDGRIRQQFIPKIGVVDGLRSLQTAQIIPRLTQIKEADGRNKRYDVEIMWDNACDIVCDDNVVCDFPSTKLSTNTQQYSLGFVKSAGFVVSEMDYIDNEFNAAEAIAKGIAKSDKELVECYARYCVSVLEANKGVNQMGTGSKGVVVGADTYVAPAYWDAKLMAYFARVAQLNRFSNFAIISGSNLYEEYFTIQKMLADANGKGNAALMDTFNIFFDLFNIDAVNTPDLVTYLVAQGAPAIASRAYNPPTMQTIGATQRWQVRSQFIPELVYDAFYAASCEDDLVKHEFKFKLTADLFINPEGCEANNTGILTMICGTGS